MRIRRVALQLALIIPAMTGLGQHVHPAPAPSDPPIIVSINPEARVSVTLGGELPPPAPCGQPAVLMVKVLNQGYVTSRLEAELVGNTPAGTTLDFHPAPLKGLPEELRELRIILRQPGLNDLTITFRPHNDVGDIGGRDRIHFLMRCVAT